MRILTFQRLRIRIENEAGSIRKGKDKATGRSWETEMPYAYGEIIGSKGVDGDPIDVFIGPNSSAKFAYVIHQLDKNIGHFDEDKCMLGFDDAMEAKEAYYKSYDKPDLFIGEIEAIPMDVFRKKVVSGEPQFIHASKINNAIELHAKAVQDENPFVRGSQVTVDGFHGRGVVIAVNGRRCTVKFRSGEYISRDYIYLHDLANRIHKMWRTQ
jgi:hypothetical protein